MKELNDFLTENIWIEKILKVILIILVSMLLYSIVNKLSVEGEKKTEEKKKGKINKKASTYVKLLKSIYKYLFIFVTLFIILETLGINISSIITGVGILGVVISFSLQDFLKDIIRGSTLLSDNYFKVDDIVKYNDIEGKILALGLKTTKIKDLATGNVISVANRNIDEIQVVSNHLYINIPLPYEVKLNDAENAINEIIKEIRKQTKLDKISYLGVNEFADSSINYLIDIKCGSPNKRKVKRECNKIILTVLDKHNITIPYNQLDIHNV